MNRALKRQQKKLQKKRTKNILAVGSVKEILTRGVQLYKQKQYNEALHYYAQVLAKHPENCDALYLKGAALIALKQEEKAEEVLKTCLSIQEETPAAHHNLGLIYHERGAFEEASAAFSRALELDPKNKVTAFFLARAQEKNNNESSQPYIQTLYESGAAVFEQNLVANLRYDGPKRLIQKLTPFIENFKNPITLDLGCGTGLMGVELSAHTAELYGVDLAQNMVQEAAKKKVYKELKTASLQDFLQQSTMVFDVITAADVFIYVGDLAETFTRIKQNLNPGGICAFTAETLAEEHEKDIFLDKGNNRHKHKNSYLKRLAKGAGFKVELLEEDFLRYENNKGVKATYVILRG